MRLFSAVVPPANVLEDLAQFVAPRSEQDGPWRWNTDEQWHITLAFMAAVEDWRIEGLVEGMRSAAARRSPFELGIAGAGNFPDPAAARVLYGQLTGDLAELAQLATGCRSAAGQVGLQVDGGRYRPHVTLARTAKPFNATKWLQIFDSYTSPTWTVSEIMLIQSHLGEGPHGRPRYELVESFAIAGAQSAN
jgi:2'-5' RNA ligase